MMGGLGGLGPPSGALRGRAPHGGQRNNKRCRVCYLRSLLASYGRGNNKPAGLLFLTLRVYRKLHSVWYGARGACPPLNYIEENHHEKRYFAEAALWGGVF